MRFSCFALVALLGCETSEPECTEAIAITGQIVEGKEVPTGSTVTVPHKIAVVLHTTIPVLDVTVGGVPAELKSLASQRWEALLFTADLERNRDGDAARLVVEATDRCGNTTAIDTASIALGPAPGIAVQDLALDEQHMPDECYLPSGGTVPSLVDVSAHAASAGAKVVLHASSGVFENGAATQEVVLRNAGDKARASVFYVADKAGAATITATANGDTATPLVLPVADTPSVNAPTGELTRDVGYTATFTSWGNFDSCQADEVIVGAATIDVLEPALGALDGSVSVRQPTMTCATLERVRIQVRFATSAPNGAAVTVRCFDTYGRSVAATFHVQTLPTP